MSPSDHKSIAATQSPELPLPASDPSVSTHAAPDSGGQGKPDSTPSAGSVKPGLVNSAGGVLPGTGAGGSIECVLEARLRQIARGYTPEHDAQGPDVFLENQCCHALYRGKLNRQKGEDKVAALQRARNSYVEAAAFALALIDRIDFITARSSSGAVAQTTPTNSTKESKGE